jgi:hypothetical protein
MILHPAKTFDQLEKCLCVVGQGPRSESGFVTELALSTLCCMCYACASEAGELHGSVFLHFLVYQFQSGALCASRCKLPTNTYIPPDHVTLRYWAPSK